MSVNYLTDHYAIAETKVDRSAKPRLCADGYTRRDGSPTETMIKIVGSNCWRRMYVLQFSNAASYFVRVGGKLYFLRDYDLIR